MNCDDDISVQGNQNFQIFGESGGSTFYTLVSVVGTAGNIFTLDPPREQPSHEEARINLEIVKEKVEGKVHHEKEEEDFLVCGRCKSQFSQLELFVEHKKICCGWKEKASTTPVTITNHLLSQKSYYDPPPIATSLPDPAVPPPDQQTLTILSAGEMSLLEGARVVGQVVEAGLDTVDVDKTGLHQSDTGATTSRKYFCSYCQKSFKKSSDLSQHIRSHTGEKPFQCVICGRGFAQKSNVKKHMVTHKVWPKRDSRLPKSEAKILSTTPSTVVNLETTSLTPTTTTQCPTQSRELDTIITAQTKLQTQLAPHTAALSAQPSHSNPHPLQEQHQVFLIDQHKQSDKEVDESINAKELEAIESGDGEELENQLILVQNYYQCPYCDLKFSKYLEFKSHKKTHTEEKCYRCITPGCGQLFTTLAKFVEHSNTHPSQEYRCHVCPDKFTDLNDLNLHQYIHLTDKDTREKQVFECQKCRNKYTSQEALEYHAQTDQHSYPCGVCGKEFSAERFLKKHLVSAHNEGSFRCDVCEKLLKNEHYLVAHRRIHTGELPFTCEICDARFNRKDKLKRHRLSHNSAKTFKCPFREHINCTREFHRFDKLKLHIMTHGSIKPFKCDVCGHGFSRKEHLKTHTAKQHKDNPQKQMLQQKQEHE